MKCMNRLKVLDLPILAYRRLRCEPTEVFKLKKMMFSVKSDTLPPLDKESQTRGNSQKLKSNDLILSLEKKCWLESNRQLEWSSL